ncbi:ABC transporter substrate-binding protein [Microbacterium sp. YY-01]|uniref:ABC transporter substrate-binding protein n=1 Tax=Microbacterium sp. YY-01 TaxID=3421634 RepID=UPI003D163152
MMSFLPLRHTRAGWAVAALAATAMLVTACGSGNPLDDQPAGDTAAPDAGEQSTIVVGSQAYYSNEIIAEIYAQALENAGLDVKRQFSIGQRDAYMPEIISGAITVFPEYTGNLLEFFDPDTQATSPDEVYAALQEALPEGLVALDYAEASDQDTYTVTKAFADEHGLTSIFDLANVDGEVTIGAAPEFEQRPYGPDAAQQVYGVDLAFSATGPTTLDALLAGTIQVADIYSADPAFETEDIVALDDPENMILSSNVVPIVSSSVADQVADIINAVSAKLTVAELVSLNVLSTVDQQEAPEIAQTWLSDQGLI